MQASQLRPASMCAANYGVKILIHGGPGSGKTPMIATTPSPVLIDTEPGLLSLRHSDVPTWVAQTGAQIDEFFTWLKNSAEARNYDTVAIDSVSQMCEIYLREAQSNNKHGLKAYGDMATAALEHLTDIFYMPQKHVYLVAKQQLVDQGGGLMKAQPYFPGREMPVKVPHLYDEILCAGTFQIPGVQGEQRAIRTLDSLTVRARDRSGKLGEYEPCDIGAIIAKCMA